MKNTQKKLEHLKWLKLMGIEYYHLDKKDSKKSIFEKINELPLPEKSVHTQKNNQEKQLFTIKNKSEQQEQKLGEIASNITKKIPPQTPSISQAKTTNNQDLNSITSINELRDAIENFEGCDLKNFAKNTVFADGSEDAKIMLIGEAPGASEDEQGIPFCGESGILLDKMFEAIGYLRKNNLYITNSVFWRPPANRKPTKDEIAICKPYLEKHISLIKPKLIVMIGATAASALLSKEQLKQDEKYLPYKNQFMQEETTATSLFHPAYLLRQPGKKKVAWFDLLKIKEFMLT